MPRKRAVDLNNQKKGILASLLSQFRSGESYTNLILGAIVVIAIGITVIILVRNNKQGQTSSTTDTQSSEEQIENAMTSSTYTIKAGDSLWSISEQIYKTGYNWTQIAKENNLENPGLIHAGNKLKLPSIKNKIAVSTKSQEKTVLEKSTPNDSISGNNYTVKRGDNLWNISVRAYGNGFRYVEIAKANNLANPRLIHSGNVLKIPREQ